MKRILLFNTLIILFFGLSVSASSVGAQSINEDSSYDLNFDHSEKTITIDDNGFPIEISIKETDNRLDMANKTYTVTKKALTWNVSYKLVIKNNKIVKAYNLITKTKIGYFSNSSLKRVNTQKCSWSARQHYGLANQYVSCVSLIKSGKLIVS